MLSDMNMTFNEFQSICIVSGTDYNVDVENNTNLIQTLKLFKKYKYQNNTVTDSSNNNNINNNSTNSTQKSTQKSKKNSLKNNLHISFYEWLENNTKYIKNCVELYSIQDMFDLTKMPEYKPYEKISIVNGPIHKPNLMNVLEKENFLFA
jgi:hypothetical protein